MESTITVTETTSLDSSENRLPVEVSLTIVCAGFIGLVLPGPFGAPLIVGGGLSLWTRVFRPIDRWVELRMPRAHASGSNWLIRFRTDLERRYPASTAKMIPNKTKNQSNDDDTESAHNDR